MIVLAQAAEAAAGDTAEIVLFWVFAVLALGAAIAVISMRNIVHGALMLVVNFLAIAGLYLTLESSFLSIIQVLVYAGAIMVLFLFVIMLLGVDNDDLLGTDRGPAAAAIAGGALLAGALVFAFVGPYTSEASICGPDAVAATGEDVDCVGLAEAYDDDDGAGVAFLGRAMFTRYTYPFELSALLLTVATIGAVILARRRDLVLEDEDEAFDHLPSEPDHPDDPAASGTDVRTRNGEQVDAAADRRPPSGREHAPGSPQPDDREG